MVLKINTRFQHANFLCAPCDVTVILFEYLMSREQEEILRKLSVIYCIILQVYPLKTIICIVKISWHKHFNEKRVLDAFHDLF